MRMQYFLNNEVVKVEGTFKNLVVARLFAAKLRKIDSKIRFSLWQAGATWFCDFFISKQLEYKIQKIIRIYENVDNVRYNKFLDSIKGKRYIYRQGWV